MESTIDRLGLSARAFNRILIILRTISDLNGKTDVGSNDVSEAIQ
jgi:magnesium chelatase family protein